MASGIALSFTLVTLLGTVVLSALGLPSDVLRWAGVALGAVYSPCAGPVLAAVTVAGATGQIGWDNVVLAVSFAVGACTPLFFFALAGKQIGTRADWTAGVQEKFNASDRTQDALQQVNGVSHGDLDACRDAAPDQLQDCGPVPQLAGLEGWLNTDQPVDPQHPARIEGKQSVTLVDFWAYACINCQRANEHVTKLFDHYRSSGLQVVGVHAPEYAFEHEAANVEAAVREQHINYPVAQDNSFATWRAFNNRYWPAHYLVDHTGQVRQIHEGEGAYAETEQLVRRLLTEANPSISLARSPLPFLFRRRHQPALPVPSPQPRNLPGRGACTVFFQSGW